MLDITVETDNRLDIRVEANDMLDITVETDNRLEITKQANDTVSYTHLTLPTNHRV